MFALFIVRRSPGIGPEYEVYPPGIDKEVEHYIYEQIGLEETSELSLDKILIDSRGELHIKGAIYTEHDYDDVGIYVRAYLAHKVPDRNEGYYVVALRDKGEEIHNDYLEPVLSRIAAEVNKLITQMTVVPIKEIRPEHIQKLPDIRRENVKKSLPGYYKLVIAVARGDEESLYPTLLESENARKIFEALREEPIITLDELMDKVGDVIEIHALGEKDILGVIESILRDFDTYELVKLEDFEDRGRVVFLVRDIFAFRKRPPSEAMPSDESIKEIINTYFESYMPSKEDERTIILTMADPFKNSIIKELRKGPKTASELSESIGVSDESILTYALSSLAEDEFVIAYEHEGNPVYALKTDVYVRVVVPKRLRRRAAELYLKRRELQELVLRYLDILDAVEIASR